MNPMHIDPESVKTVFMAAGVMFITEAWKKSGQTVGQALMEKVTAAIANLRIQAPELAKAIEAGDITALESATLAQIEEHPSFAEAIAAAEAEGNPQFQELWQGMKAGGTINIIGKLIKVSQGGKGNTQTNTFSNF